VDIKPHSVARNVGWIALIALAIGLVTACWSSAAPTPPPAAEATPPPEVPPPPPPPPPPPRSPVKSDPVVTFYDRGKFKQLALSQASSGDGCIGTPDQLAACKQVKPNFRCELAPPAGYGADFVCSGAARPIPAPPPPTHCECTCTDAYLRAEAEQDRRRAACGNPP
jgi:hypothetical protein